MDNKKKFSFTSFPIGQHVMCEFENGQKHFAVVSQSASFISIFFPQQNSIKQSFD